MHAGSGRSFRAYVFTRASPLPAQLPCAEPSELLPATPSAAEARRLSLESNDSTTTVAATVPATVGDTAACTEADVGLPKLAGEQSQWYRLSSLSLPFAARESTLTLRGSLKDPYLCISFRIQNGMSWGIHSRSWPLAPVLGKITQPRLRLHASAKISFKCIGCIHSLSALM